LARLLVRRLLVLVIIAGVVSAVWTVLPDSRAQKVSDLGKALGYKTHCPFAPYSTMISVAIALVALFFARRSWR
jgi:uncharacterized membrane protein